MSGPTTTTLIAHRLASGIGLGLIGWGLVEIWFPLAPLVIGSLLWIDASVFGLLIWFSTRRTDK